jgi:hypothetical protein
MMDEGIAETGGQNIEMLPESGVIWLEAPESATRSATAGGVNAMVLKELANDCWSYDPFHGFHIAEA